MAGQLPQLQRHRQASEGLGPGGNGRGHHLPDSRRPGRGHRLRLRRPLPSHHGHAGQRHHHQLRLQPPGRARQPQPQPRRHRAGPDPHVHPQPRAGNREPELDQRPVPMDGLRQRHPELHRQRPEPIHHRSRRHAHPRRPGQPDRRRGVDLHLRRGQQAQERDQDGLHRHARVRRRRPAAPDHAGGNGHGVAVRRHGLGGGVQQQRQPAKALRAWPWRG
ncbi:hypothetical protein SDC9_101269 [bioreactor metagenome]|uniref:Uncharacterized protein n=1 Tax=bioreactor metagenome TaxID=1076179 RepID=A0A645AQ85_9ZZZZ